jgi:hypothetical protein
MIAILEAVALAATALLVWYILFFQTPAARDRRFRSDVWTLRDEVVMKIVKGELESSKEAWESVALIERLARTGHSLNLAIVLAVLREMRRGRIPIPPDLETRLAGCSPRDREVLLGIFAAVHRRTAEHLTRKDSIANLGAIVWVSITSRRRRQSRSGIVDEAATAGTLSDSWLESDKYVGNAAPV